MLWFIQPMGALNFIAKIPINPELGVWMHQLGACKLNVVGLFDNMHNKNIVS